MEPPATEPVSSTYHVFINHRGPDVKKTLASFIYHRLTNCHGLRVFLDQKELHTGDALSPAILGAIESASVHIAIFSKRYAVSRWCLDELCWILRCNRKIIPVFCDVEPTDLRYIDSESGCYRKAFEEHQRKGRVAMEDIEKWKTALNKASEISGLMFKTNESDHGEVLEEIVKAVLKGVKWEPFEVAKYLVGLDPAVKEINDEIKKQSQVNGTAIVGIAGMAGVGKSTLATYLYNLKRSDFSRSCFLSEIRKKDLPSLQRKLLRDLLGCDFHIEDTRQGKGIFRDRLGGLQVLIVLDDADHIEQINSLPVTDVVGSRSLILITSRDQDLLRRSSPKTVLYNLKPLQREHAQELFCRHAFDQAEPYEGLESLVEEVLKICSGLPLSLQVLGGLFLGRREEKYWKRQLERLSRRLPDDIMDTLKVSYEALKGDEKEIFLDIGCFLEGEDKEVAVRVFEGLGYKDACDCLENLRQKCLVEYQDEVQSDDEIESRPKKIVRFISVFYVFPFLPTGCSQWDLIPPNCFCFRQLKIDGLVRSNLSMQIISHDSNGNYDYDYLYPGKRDKIRMHDHIRQLARHITREEFGVLPTRKPLRLSSLNDVEELMLKLQGGADSCLIRGIRTPEGQNLPDCTNYIKGVGVRLMVVEVPIDLSSLFVLWPMSGDLVWLRLRSFSSIYFPGTISLRNVRVLELEGHGDLEQFFQRFNMPPRNLSVLNIDVTGTEPWAILNPSVHPTGLQQSRRLSRGRARRMPRKNNWVKSGASTSSSSFDLDDSEVISAQEGFRAPYFLRFLKWIGSSIKIPSKIVLKHITFLQSLPIGFGELKKLRHLDLSGCTNLTQLPYSFSELMHVQYLVLRDCSQLSIPMDFLGNMSSLEYVDFKGCRKLKYLPTGIENQKYLRYLNLLSTGLKCPISLKLPEKLQRLRIGNFTESAESAESAEIKLITTNFTESAESAESAEIKLITTDFTESAESAEINLKLLEKLHCSYGRGQSYFPQREHLQETKLRQCLGDLRRLKELKELVLLDLDGAERILWEEIAGPDMKVLVIRDCPISIFRFKKKGTMQIGTVLRDFTLSGTQITEICIPESVLPSLETLDLSGNRQLIQVKNLPSTLLRLNLQGCRLLDTLINLSNLVDLKLLKVNLCHRLKTLNVEGLTSLEEIQAEACWELKSIQGLSQRERLKSLSISTNTDAIWNDICNFLASTSHENLSTAFFSGTVGKSSTFRRRDRAFYEMVEKFNLKVVDVIYLASLDVLFPASPSEYEFQTKMEEFQSYGAMFMCFLTFSPPRYTFCRRTRYTISHRRASCIQFLFRFEASNDEGPAEEYEFVAGVDEQNLHLHVFMWTEECNLLRDYKGCTKIGVSCNLKPSDVKRGWIMMVDKNTQVSQVCREIIIALS